VFCLPIATAQSDRVERTKGRQGGRTRWTRLFALFVKKNATLRPSFFRGVILLQAQSSLGSRCSFFSLFLFVLAPLLLLSKRIAHRRLLFWRDRNELAYYISLLPPHDLKLSTPQLVCACVCQKRSGEKSEDCATWGEMGSSFSPHTLCQCYCFVFFFWILPAQQHTSYFFFC
jgi:hypothetical protein